MDSDRRKSRAKAGGRAAAQSPSRTYPLRKVVGHDEAMDELDCGHILAGASDIMGRRYPDRRRCFKCAKGMPTDA